MRASCSTISRSIMTNWPIKLRAKISRRQADNGMAGYQIPPRGLRGEATARRAAGIRSSICPTDRRRHYGFLQIDVAGASPRAEERPARSAITVIARINKHSIFFMVVCQGRAPPTHQRPRKAPGNANASVSRQPLPAVTPVGSPGLHPGRCQSRKRWPRTGWSV